MLKDLLETGAGALAVTSAHSVAGFRTPLGGTDMSKKKKKKKSKKSKKAKLGPVGNMYSFKMFHESEDSDFDSSDVISKLKDSAKKAKVEGEGSTAFALEDEDGRMAKIWVPDDQADDFEASLEQALNGNDEDNDDDNSETEIAEVLWNLRKDFDIINVEWPDDIPEDQEETLPADVQEEPAPGEEGDPAAGLEGGEDELGAEGEPGAEDMTADAGMDAGGEASAETALQSVIKMMQSDAEARTAEANAKAAEAKAREAEAGMKMAQDKVDQEEKTLDMEAYYDKQKEEKGETERLAKLAKYQHDLAGEKTGGLSGGTDPEEIGNEMPVGDAAEPPMGGPEEQEEYSRYGDTHMSKAELGSLLLKALRR